MLKSLPIISHDVLLYIELNPIEFLISGLNTLTIDGRDETNNRIRIWNNFRRMYYALRLKDRFRKFLWERVLGPKIENKYHPKNLALLLQDKNEDDMFDDQLLETW
jgi:hypothetical protein